MTQTIDHFVDENGENIYISVMDASDYVGLNADRKLLSSQQPTINYLTELPSTQGNSNLFIDVAHALFD